MTKYIAPRAKLLYHADRLAAIKAGQTPPPVNVEIDLSNRCDLKCAGCHFAYTHTRGPWAGKAYKPDGAISGGDLMDVELAHRILFELKEAGVKSVTWTGGGEPTLHPQFNGIIHWANGWGIEQGIYSHGAYITGDRAAWMKQHFAWVYFSLDAYDRDSYRQYKGVDRFDRVTENIRRIAALDGKATIGAGFLLHTGNCDRVGDMVALGKDLGVDYVQFRPVIHYSQEAPAQQVDDVQWISRAINALRKYAGDPFVQADPWRFEAYRDWTGHGYSTCYWSALQTVITPNGKVWRCTNKREHPDALLGDLTQESFAKLWAGAGGPCQVDGRCRVMCRGQISNITLDAIMTETEHVNFI